LRMQDDGDLVMYAYAYMGANKVRDIYFGPWVWSSKRGKNPLISASASNQAHYDYSVVIGSANYKSKYGSEYYV